MRIDCSTRCRAPTATSHGPRPPPPAHLICHNDERACPRIRRDRAPQSRDGAATGHWLAAIGAALAPGALLGAHLALLLFFLNPRLDLEATTVARAGVVLALALGIGIGAPLALALRGRPDRLLSALPWGVTAALALAAAAQWAHAALFAYYLPPGINVRLLKAATGVSILTVFCFYTALLHSMQRRRYGWRSRGAIAMVALLSIVLTAERRWAFPRPPPPPLELGMRARPAQTNLAVIALEGATLDAILPLAEQGQLPFFSTLLRQGAYARLKTLSPPMRVAVWRSVATGAYPFRHGVVSDRTFAAPFLAPTTAARADALGQRIRSVGAAARRAHQRPAAGLARAGAVADPRRRRARHQRRGLARHHRQRPARRVGRGAARLVLRGSRPGGARPRRPAPAPSGFDPRSRTLDPTVFAPLGDAAPACAKNALIGDLWREAVARDLLARSPSGAPTAIFVGLPGLLEISRGSFGGYAAVHFDGDSRTVQREAAQLVSGYYVFVDRIARETVVEPARAPAAGDRLGPRRARAGALAPAALAGVAGALARRGGSTATPTACSCCWGTTCARANGSIEAPWSTSRRRCSTP